MPFLDYFSEGLERADTRGWAMRKGHRKRFAKCAGRESQRGRASFARSVNRDRPADSDRIGLAKWQQRAVFDLDDEAFLLRGGRLKAAAAAPAVPAPPYPPPAPLVPVAAAQPAEPVDEEIAAPPALRRQRSLPATAAEREQASEAVRSRLPLSAWAACFRGQVARAPKEVVREELSPWERASALAAQGRKEYLRLLKQRACWEAMLQDRRRRAVSMAIAERKEKARLLRDEFVKAFPRDPNRERPMKRLYKASLEIHKPVTLQPCDPAPLEHSKVLEFAQPRKFSTPVPKCWEGSKKEKVVKELKQELPEFKAVAGHFMATIGNANAKVQSIVRLQNPQVYETCLDRQGFGATSVMFHGCKQKANEENIIANGFQVSCCVSGGSGFGTWFAYRASYSNSGFVYVDRENVRHIFMCMVTDRYVVRSDSIMRVVGQGCAYPLWLLKYTV